MAARRVCVVGAGVAGITCAKELAERGIPFDWFERSDRLGGMWSYGNPSGSPAYDTLHLNSSRRCTELPGYPMPADYPDYPSHERFLAYLESYVDHFGLGDRITFTTEVRRARPRPGGGWWVELSDGTARAYDGLVAANGHHRDPLWPEPPHPGTFDGELIHALRYQSREELRGRHVVVLGAGNTAIDIIVEASKVAASATLAIRRPTHILPKYLLRRPIDQLPNDPRIPYPVRRAVFERLLRVAHGRMSDFGLPEPDHRLGQAHPTVSDEVFDRLRLGTIAVKPDVAGFEGDRVRFVDGSAVAADFVIFATGYRITFPFLDPAVLVAPENESRLFLNIFKPGQPDLAVVGLVQTVGSNIRMAGAQAMLVAEHFAGDYALPPMEEMERDIARTDAARARRYVASPRHTIEVEHRGYLRRIARERRTGARRARKQRLPELVPQ